MAGVEGFGQEWHLLRLSKTNRLGRVVPHRAAKDDSRRKKNGREEEGDSGKGE